jgi:histidyl-tRNA synthetase
MLPRGMRDFPPETAILRKDVFSRLEKVFRRFGFDPLETPIVEFWDTIRGKYGGEAEEKLIYAFKDKWGGKELALRYDLTVPLARFISENPGVPLPFKRYSIGRVYRHERPQRGRYREFYQCDIDIAGAGGPEADAEILTVIDAVMREFKLPGYVIKLNDRRLLSGIFGKGLGITRNLPAVYRAIDKIDKSGWAAVSKELKQVVPAGKVGEIKDVIEIRGSPDSVLDKVKEDFGKIAEVGEATAHLEEMLALAKKASVRLDLSMVRGLDYYTGPIFETVVKSPKIGSITGGGRYDGLLGLYGKDLPATGTTIGVERLIDAGIALKIFKKSKSVAQAYVVDMDCREYAWRVASALRGEGINTRVDLMGRSWKKQMDEANKLGVRFVAIVGKKEEQAGKVTLLDKEKDTRALVSLVEAAGTVKSLSRT